MKRFLIGALACISLSIFGCGATTPQPPPAATESPVATVPASNAEPILARLEQETQFKPQIDTWGQGQGLFMVDTGWESLSQIEKESIIEYCKANDLKAIVVGRLVKKSTGNSIMLDRTVWGE